MKVNLAIVGLVAALVAPAFGAPRPQAYGTKPVASKLAAAVSLENRRRVQLLSFEIVASRKDKTPETVIGRLEKPLASGASASFPLNGAKGCDFEARWVFADMQDSGDVDLCNEAHIVLVD